MPDRYLVEIPWGNAQAVILYVLAPVDTVHPPEVHTRHSPHRNIALLP